MGDVVRPWAVAIVSRHTLIVFLKRVKKNYNKKQRFKYSFRRGRFGSGNEISSTSAHHTHEHKFKGFSIV